MLQILIPYKYNYFASNYFIFYWIGKSCTWHCIKLGGLLMQLQLEPSCWNLTCDKITSQDVLLKHQRQCRKERRSWKESHNIILVRNLTSVQMKQILEEPDPSRTLFTRTEHSSVKGVGKHNQCSLPFLRNITSMFLPTRSEMSSSWLFELDLKARSLAAALPLNGSSQPIVLPPTSLSWNYRIPSLVRILHLCIWRRK